MLLLLHGHQCLPGRPLASCMLCSSYFSHSNMPNRVSPAPPGSSFLADPCTLATIMPLCAMAQAAGTAPMTVRCTAPSWTRWVGGAASVQCRRRGSVRSSCAIACWLCAGFSRMFQVAQALAVCSGSERKRWVLHMPLCRCCRSRRTCSSTHGVASRSWGPCLGPSSPRHLLLGPAQGQCQPHSSSMPAQMACIRRPSGP